MSDREQEKYKLSQKMRDCGISAYAVKQQPIISIYCDNFYENYDYDTIPPNQRKKCAIFFKQQSMRAKTSRCYEYGDYYVVYPKPPRTLGSCPIDEIYREIKAKNIILTTPTQAILFNMQQCHANKQDIDKQEVYNLAYLQPANIEKIKQWGEHEGYGYLFDPFYSKCKRIQQFVFSQRERKLRKLHWNEQEVFQSIQKLFF